MNINEALRERRLLINNIAKLEGRAKDASYDVEYFGDDGKTTKIESKYTKEEFNTFMDAIVDKRKELVELKKKITRANLIKIDGICIQDLVIERGELKAQLEFMFRFSVSQDVYGNKRTISRLSANEINKETDAFTDAITKIDKQIISLNSKIEI